MISIKIGSEERQLEEMTLQWLHESIDSRRKMGADASVLITIDSDDVDLVLRAPARPGRGSAREFSKAEDFIIDRWNHLELSNQGYSVESLYNFLRLMRGFA